MAAAPVPVGRTVQEAAVVLGERAADPVGATDRLWVAAFCDCGFVDSAFASRCRARRGLGGSIRHPGWMQCSSPPVPRSGRLDGESAEWLAALAGADAVPGAALSRLHALLLRAARAEAARRGPVLGVGGVEHEDVAQQAVDDALVAIVDKLAQFRGDSRFTRWAYGFVVVEVAGKLTRHAWRRAAPARVEEDWGLLPDRFGFGPAEAMEWSELFVALRGAVEQDLTARQRRIFVAIVLQGVPWDVLAQERGSNRNAIYKSLFDARRKLRARLVANGYMDRADVTERRTVSSRCGGSWRPMPPMLAAVRRSGCLRATLIVGSSSQTRSLVIPASRRICEPAVRAPRTSAACSRSPARVSPERDVLRPGQVRTGRARTQVSDQPASNARPEGAR